MVPSVKEMNVLILIKVVALTTAPTPSEVMSVSALMSYHFLKMASPAIMMNVGNRTVAVKKFASILLVEINVNVTMTDMTLVKMEPHVLILMNAWLITETVNTSVRTTTVDTNAHALLDYSSTTTNSHAEMTHAIPTTETAPISVNFTENHSNASASMDINWLLVENVLILMSVLSTMEVALITAQTLKEASSVSALKEWLFILMEEHADVLVTNAMVHQPMKNATKTALKSAHSVLMPVKTKSVSIMERNKSSNDASNHKPVRTISSRTQDLHGFQVSAMVRKIMMFADAVVKDISAMLQKDHVLLKKNAIFMRLMFLSFWTPQAQSSMVTSKR
jgi:hypothetical protein